MAKDMRTPAAVDNMMASLNEIAQNLWWSWNRKAIELFEYADPKAFATANNNPVLTLRKLSTVRKRQLAADTAFGNWMRGVLSEQRRYLADKTWYDGQYGKTVKGCVAYFCMEYAVHESLPLYAGGLGVLAGDHLKSSSDLGLPLVAIGIYWRKGYTRQQVDANARQQDVFPVLRPDDAPVMEVTDKAGKPLRVKVPVGGDTLTTRVWCMDVGRVPLYLLDTDIPENSPRDRKLTHVLYSGDRDTRIRQEILLGIGGWRVLKALRLPVTACHLNEGHAVFVSIERIAERMAKTGESFAKACKYVTDTSIFTTHTPVPAGNETFDPALVAKYMDDYRKKLNISHAKFFGLARVKPNDESEPFGMTPLALRTSRHCNGVAALHGQVARKMWKNVYPGKQLKDVPIGNVTNGIHLQTWLHPRMADLYEEYLGPDWADQQEQPKLWQKLLEMPDEVLWNQHLEFKQELIDFCRNRLKEQLRRSRVPGMSASGINKILSPDALTIGFARRFAPYKRATLVFSDLARFAKILNNKSRPVQIIFAGKAHPADDAGKALIAALVKYSRSPRFRNRVVFLEDYDMEVARHLVAGCDVWLNNPRRPQEASGTSGMKPTLHGGMNLSILDGWWPEGYNGSNGWAIGTGKDHDGTDAGDKRDAQNLYKVLEQKVVPLFFKRNAAGLPTQWIKGMKNALTTIPYQFNSHRQVGEYLSKYYLPALKKA